MKPEPQSDLIQYFINKTDERFASIDSKLADLTKFKVEMIVNARWVALLVSAVCGFTTLVINVGVSFYLNQQSLERIEKKAIPVNVQPSSQKGSSP